MKIGKFLTLTLILIFSGSLAAQTLNLECDLEGSDLRYQGGKLLKDQSCDGVKKKCSDKYYITIEPNKFIYSSVKSAEDKDEINPLKDKRPAYWNDSRSSSSASWRGNAYWASSIRTNYSEAYDGRPAYESQNHDYWEINRMTGSVTRKHYSTISPNIPSLYTYTEEMSGTCKPFTPKF